MALTTVRGALFQYGRPQKMLWIAWEYGFLLYGTGIVALISFLSSVSQMGMTILPYKIQGDTVLDYEPLAGPSSLGVRQGMWIVFGDSGSLRLGINSWSSCLSPVGQEGVLCGGSSWQRGAHSGER